MTVYYSVSWIVQSKGCVYHHTSGVELRFPNDFQGDFFAETDAKRKAILIRELETPFFCYYAFLIVGIETCF